MLQMNCMLQVNWRRIGVLLPGVRQVGLDCPDKLVPPGVLLPGVRQVGLDCPDKLVPPGVLQIAASRYLLNVLLLVVCNSTIRCIPVELAVA